MPLVSVRRASRWRGIEGRQGASVAVEGGAVDRGGVDSLFGLCARWRGATAKPTGARVRKASMRAFADGIRRFVEFADDT